MKGGPSGQRTFVNKKEVVKECFRNVKRSKDCSNMSILGRRIGTEFKTCMYPT
jgi:hypothetical protein